MVSPSCKYLDEMFLLCCAYVNDWLVFSPSSEITHGGCIRVLGDLKNEDSVLEWLTDDENRELADEIESVNSRMLERILDESPFLAVFFCKFLPIAINNRNCGFPFFLILGVSLFLINPICLYSNPLLLVNW